MSEIVDDIIEYENEGIDEEKEIKLFQKLVNNGQAWRLQGSFGRQASSMLSAGVIHPPNKLTRQNNTDFYGNKIFTPSGLESKNLKWTFKNGVWKATVLKLPKKKNPFKRRNLRNRLFRNKRSLKRGSKHINDTDNTIPRDIKQVR